MTTVEKTEQTQPRLKQRYREEIKDALNKEFAYANVISLIARSCGGDRAPDGLRSRIRVRLTEVTIETAVLEYLPE